MGRFKQEDLDVHLPRELGIVCGSRRASECMTFERIAIIGVGLIGGSLGLAFKRGVPTPHILGIGRNPQSLDLAQRMGAIDASALSPSGVLEDRDLVILASPVEHILKTLDTLGSELRTGTLVSDVGSTKRLICQHAWRSLPPGIEFIGGHPVAGREVAGIANILPGLFKGAPYVLCPRPGASPEMLSRLTRLVELVEARPIIMDAERHDQAIAWVSHLPQLLSTALAGQSLGKDTQISGSGFRDMIRLAASPLSVWQGIVDSNLDNIDWALRSYINGLEEMRVRLMEGKLSEDFRRAEAFCRATRQ